MTPPPRNRGGRPPSRIILPCGRQVLGWAAAQLALGVHPINLRMRADWDDNAGAWKIRPPTRKRFRRD
jgi:hypothetical protein